MRRTLAAATTAVALAAALSGCGRTVSPATAVKGWASAGSFSQGVQTLRRDATRIHRAIAAGRPAIQVRTDCLELFQDANGENTDLLPSPDPQLTAHLSASYDGFVHASDQCSSSPGRAATLVVVDHGLARAIGDLYAAVLRYEAVVGAPLGVPGLQ
jgi:hypothetical protein